jgi:hypothetical protein
MAIGDATTSQIKLIFEAMFHLSEVRVLAGRNIPQRHLCTSGGKSTILDFGLNFLFARPGTVSTVKVRTNVADMKLLSGKFPNVVDREPT